MGKGHCKHRLAFICILFLSPLFGLAQDNDNPPKQERALISSFKLSGGLTLNNLDFDSNSGLDTETTNSWNAGLSYQRGRLLYAELGARLNVREFDVATTSTNSLSEISIAAIDIPLSVGVNLTSYLENLIGVRVYVGAVPSFTVDTDVDDLGLTRDDVEDFSLYGQAGIGMDFSVLCIEAGYNFGFDDIIIQGSKSVPNQIFINFGFRL